MDEAYALKDGSASVHGSSGQLPLPLVVEAPEADIDLVAHLPHIETVASQHLTGCGAILLRGFELRGPEDFRRFAEGFGDPLLSYEFGSTPRTAVTGGIYTATEYPAHARIPLHNEQSYTREWGMRLWFYCKLPASTGGETPIADSRRILAGIDPEVKRKFISRGLLYVRNYGNGLDVSWQRVFNTSDPQQVEIYCRARGIHCEWKPDGELRTRQVCQVVERHPQTGEEVWFNQAHLFHISALEPEIRELLLESVAEEDLPRNVYFADGTPLEAGDLDHIRHVIDAEASVFTWQRGDVLMLDNMLCAHGRAAFAGPREVLVAMARRHANLTI